MVISYNHYISGYWWTPAANLGLADGLFSNWVPYTRLPQDDERVGPRMRLENSSREITVNDDFGIGNDFLMTLSHFQLSDPSMKRSEKKYSENLVRCTHSLTCLYPGIHKQKPSF